MHQAPGRGDRALRVVVLNWRDLRHPDGGGSERYIETIARWRQRFAEPSVRKTLVKARLVPHWLFSREFRLAFTSGVSANTVCFERELLEHYRLVFERPAD